MEPSQKLEHILVGAIDFGTTFSSWAFSFRHDYQSNPTKIYTKSWNSGINISLKAPTTLLIRPDGKTLEAFGYNAEDKYTQLVASDDHHPWFYFRRFKMSLHDNKKLNRDKMIEDEEGKRLPAMTVISLAIEHLKNDLYSVCAKQIAGGMSEDSIHWVLTVPAIWNDKAKHFMREAAMKAGIPENQLTLAIEPEAASVYCRHIPLQAKSTDGKTCIVPLSEGTRYILVDAGGGTVDVTIHEVMKDGNIKELHKATGGAWGGQEVDQAFKQFLIKIFGGPVIQKFHEEAMDDYIGIFRDFETKKRKVTMDGVDQYVLSLPLTLVEIFEQTTNEKLKDAIVQTTFASKIQILKGNKLRLDHSLMKNFFEKAVTSIVNHVQTFHDAHEIYGVSVALLVGGFSESSVLVSAIKDKCPSWMVVVPEDAALTVLKGAVLYGHDPSTITYRVSRYTYGKKGVEDFKDGVHPRNHLKISSEGYRYCSNVFKPFIYEGSIFKNGDILYENRNVKPVSDLAWFDLKIYASTDKNAKYTTEECCTFIGKVRVDQLDVKVPLKQRNAHVIISFEHSEIKVHASDMKSGRELKASFDMLE